MKPEDIEVTAEMKDAGGMALFKELGCQFSPDHVDLDDLAEAVYRAMRAVACPQTGIIEGENGLLLDNATYVQSSG